ncbi:hypothetical protein [Lachnoclostridium phytofermentans]|uniref:hypothetical protein n=1 Tax=Lachnoclostridium phytofermentans TaxID=66219 RepID=UPI000315505E|nr:hypothetical protein [Lachnoclostridium phytofermentans]
MDNSGIDINTLKDVLLEQINALAEWNLENINVDAEQIRKNIVTIAEIIQLMVSLNQQVSNGWL